MADSFDRGVGGWAREGLIQYEALLRELDQLRQSGRNASDLEVIEIKKKIAEFQEKSLNSSMHHCRVQMKCGFDDFLEADNADLTRGLHRYERFLKSLPTDRNEPEFADYRRFLEEGITEIGEILRTRGATLTDADHYVDRITSEIKKQAEIIRRLNEACEADVNAHPTQADQIRRTYRKAIDALREQT